MIQVETFPFNKNEFDQLKNYHFGLNWPVVYIQEDGDEMYIGQTTTLYGRSKQHYENPDRARLKRIHVLTDEEFNLSSAFDFESLLIQYVSADGMFKLQNGNGGLINHNYFEKEKYLAKIEAVWPKLQEKKLVKQNLQDIKNSEFFKYSPYKALTEDQLTIATQLEKEVTKKSSGTYIVNGGPGTGKSILALYLLKHLKEQAETKHLRAALVVPMSGLRSTLQRVLKRVPGMGAGMVIGPSDVIKSKYDLLIVDEAHRLRRRVNLTNFASYDSTNKKLALEKNATQLDWITASSEKQIFFYDDRQSVAPGDVRPQDFKNLNAMHYDLISQMRIEGGVDYLQFIDDLLDLKDVSKFKFPNYEFKIFDDIQQMIKEIKLRDKQHKLARLVAGYAWSWNTKGGKEGHDIEIDGIKLVWNSTNIDWVNSENSVNEVGCIHTVQGYDLNYAGIIIGPEISYDEKTKRLIIDEKKYKDINGKRSIAEPDELRFYIINIYKTLLTRGIKGTYVYAVDPGLRAYLTAALTGDLKVTKIVMNTKSPYMGEMINVPLFDSVGCGELMFADSTVQEMIPVKVSLMSRGSKYFVLRTSGDSMNKVGINDGDLVLCVKNYHPEVGNIVVALIGDDATIKEFHREEDAVVLKPRSSNPRHQPLIFTDNDEVKVQGVVITVLETPLE